MGLFGDILPPSSGLACARARRWWPFIIEAISLKVNPDRKCCNWCGWNCWIPGLHQLSRMFTVSFSCSTDSNPTQATWGFYITNWGRKINRTQQPPLLGVEIFSFSVMVSAVLAWCPKFTNYLFFHWLKKQIKKKKTSVINSYEILAFSWSFLRDRPNFAIS